MMEEGSIGSGCVDTSSGVLSHDRASALTFFDPCPYEMVKLNRVKNKVYLVCLSGVKRLCCPKILKIFVISVDGEWMSTSLQPVPALNLQKKFFENNLFEKKAHGRRLFDFSCFRNSTAPTPDVEASTSTIKKASLDWDGGVVGGKLLQIKFSFWCPGQRLGTVL